MENQLKKYVLDLRVVSVTPLHKSHVLLRLTHDLQLPEMLPGQFAEVRVDGSPTTFLRRPISICYVDRPQNELWLLVATVGDIDGLPRVLDAGQCNDSYSLVLIALKLREAFGLDDINDLPIVFNIAWYEQKAVIVLLALLYLGVKNIHLGPTLPAFLSPNVADVLVKNFGVAGIGAVDDDLKLFFGDTSAS